jgi:hypothetical protein
MLKGKLASRGYDLWCHSFTATNAKAKKRKAFYIEFFIINPKVSPKKIQYGQLNQKPCYTMINVGCWGDKPLQLHSFYTIKETDISLNKLEIEVAECYLSEIRTFGEVNVENANFHPEYMSDNGNIKWDLKIRKIMPFNIGYGACKLLRTMNVFEMFWHAEGMKTDYCGYIEVNDEKYIVNSESSYGYADKNWGKNFINPWIWISSSHMVSRISKRKLKNSAFDIGGSKPIIINIPLNNKLLIYIVHQGKEYNFNFALFWKQINTKFECKETETDIIWNITTTNYNSKAIITCKCNKTEMLMKNYESPDGKKLHNNLWTGGNGQGRIQLYKRHLFLFELIDDIDFYNAGCEYGEYSQSLETNNQTN